MPLRVKPRQGGRFGTRPNGTYVKRFRLYAKAQRQLAEKQMVRHSITRFPRAFINAGITVKSPIKLKYCETFGLSSNATLQGYTGAQQEWRLNSVYDPNFTGGGHQPYGYDQISLLFARYCVVGCQVKLIFSEPTGVGCQGVVKLIASNEYGYSITSKNMDVLREQTNSTILNVSSTGARKSVYSKYVSISRIDQIPYAKLIADDQYSSNVSTDPTLFPTIAVSVLNTAAATVITCQVTAQLTFYTRMMEPITLGQS